MKPNNPYNYLEYPEEPKLPNLFWLFLGMIIMFIIILTIWFNLEKAHAEEIKLTASWYSVDSLKKDGQWKLTTGVCSDGSTFNDNNFTAASRDFPLGTIVCVRNVKNGKKVVVKITDRINKRFKGKRIDLSKRAFSLLASLSQGIIPVVVEEEEIKNEGN